MRGNILVVDDSPTVNSTVGWLLTNQGYEVRLAQDGLSALGMLISFKADLILLDIRLPYVDGLQLCQLIRQTQGARVIPIIMLSGISSDEMKQRAQKLGANDYLVKPIGDRELVATIERHLVSKRPSTLLTELTS